MSPVYDIILSKKVDVESRTSGFRASAYAHARPHTSPTKRLVGKCEHYERGNHHFDLSFLIATLLVKPWEKKRIVCEKRAFPGTGGDRRTDVSLAAVEDGLVAADVLRDLRERLDDAEAELLALHLARDGDVLDVPDAAEPAQELALDKDAARADDPVALARHDDDDVVRARLAAHGLELRRPRLGADVGRLREHGEHGEVAALVVRRR